MQGYAIRQRESKAGLEEREGLFLKNEFVVPVLTVILTLISLLQDVNDQVCRKLLLNCMTGGVKGMHARSWKG